MKAFAGITQLVGDSNAVIQSDRNAIHSELSRT